jgi:hypothetical protein
MGNVAYIERITRPDDEILLREYIHQHRPVIVTDFFRGEPIRAIDSLQKARREFGHVRLMVQREYSAAEVNNQRGKTFQPMTFDEYWEVVRADPTTEMCCTEYEIPARVLAQYDLPSVCLGRDLDDAEILSLPRKYGDHDLLGNVFIANRGNKAHLHYDADQRHVLLYQVFGRKEVILFPTRSGWKLRPRELGINFSGHYLEHMTREQKLQLVAEAGGYFGVLEPGDAVYFPMLMWHYLEYIEDGMSFNVRFGRSKYGRFLSADNFHFDHYTQNLASCFTHQAAEDPRLAVVLETIIAAYTEPAQDQRQKVKSMRALFKRLCEEICPEHRAHEYCPPEHESAEIDKIMQDIGNRMVYADPKVIAKMRPSGPVSSTQARHIKENAARLGYSPALLGRLLWNRAGKSDINQLTSVEAAQFLASLRSPGAVW